LSRLLETKQGTLKFKEYTHTADAVISALLLGFPEVLKTRKSSESIYSVSDRIMVSVISNCIQNYDQFLIKLKEARKYIKYQCFIKEVIDLDHPSFKTLSWIVPCVRILNENVCGNSKQKMFRMSLLTQTRACGLAGPKIIKKSVETFLKNVTTVTTYEPNDLLKSCIDEVTTEIILDSGLKQRLNIRCSIGTSGSWECPKTKGGKFGFARDLIDQELIRRPEKIEILNDIETPTFGDSLYEYCMYQLRHNPETRKVRLSVVRENGKGRCVTSGSACKDISLQPLQHGIIEMLKCQRILKNGFQAGRLGYALYTVFDEDDPISELVQKPIVKVFSFDFSEATDHPSHLSGRDVVGTLLKKLRLPQDQIDTILSVWAGPRELYINGKLSGTIINGLMMGDPMTKVNLSMVHLIAHKYARHRTVGHDLLVHAEGNGDDGSVVIGSNSAESISLYIDSFKEACIMMGYLFAKSDTFVTDDWFTYCEEIMAIPPTAKYSQRRANRLKTNTYSTYLDIVKLRYLIDTKKDRSDFSSSTEGKITGLGKDISYVQKDGSLKEKYIFSVSSIIQDISLNTRVQRYPVYLPSQIYGVGKMPMNWDPITWYNCVKSQSNICIRLVYYTLLELLCEIPKNLTNRVGSVRFDKHFENEAYVEEHSIPDDHPITSFSLVNPDEYDKYPPGVLAKLQSEKRLIPETEISKYYLYHERLRALTEIVNVHDLFNTLRIISSELPIPRDEELLEAMYRFRERFFGRPHMMRSFRKSRLYHRSILKLLEEHDPLRVTTIEGFIGMRNKYNKQSYPEDRKRFTRHDRLVDNLEDWLLEAQLDIRNGIEPREVPTDLIEDDPVIKKNIINSGKPVSIIVTDDRKLAIECEKASNKIIYRISMKDWFLNDCYEDKFLLALKTFCNINPNDVEVFMDKGSLETHQIQVDYTRHDRTLPKIGWHTNINYAGLRSNIDNYEVLEGDYPREVSDRFIERFMHISSYSLTRLREYTYKLK